MKLRKHGRTVMGVMKMLRSPARCVGPRIRLMNGCSVSPCLFFAVAVLLIPTCMVFLISSDQITPLLVQTSPQSKFNLKGKSLEHLSLSWLSI